MDATLILFTSFGAAILSNCFARRGLLAPAGIAGGIIGGLAGLSLARVLSVEGAGWSLGLPLLLAFCLTIGLDSLQRRSVRSDESEEG